MGIYDGLLRSSFFLGLDSVAVARGRGLFFPISVSSFISHLHVPLVLHFILPRQRSICKMMNSKKFYQ